MAKLITFTAETVIFLCGIWVLSLISVLLHEFGHALGYMLATGDRDWHIQVGQGKKLLDTKVLTVNLIVIDGCFASDEDKIDSTSQIVMMLSGGPIVSLLLVIGLLVLRSGWMSLSSELFAAGAIRALYYAALIINLFILLWSVIPAHGFFLDMENVGTDDMQIIDALKRHRE